MAKFPAPLGESGIALVDHGAGAAGVQCASLDAGPPVGAALSSFVYPPVWGPLSRRVQPTAADISPQPRKRAGHQTPPPPPPNHHRFRRSAALHKDAMIIHRRRPTAAVTSVASRLSRRTVHIASRRVGGVRRRVSKWRWRSGCFHFIFLLYIVVVACLLLLLAVTWNRPAFTLKVFIP